MDWQAFGETFVTLLVIMDPVGLAPIFVSCTRTLPADQRSGAAVRATVAAGALVLGFALFGGLVLEYLNVSVEALSIAGGLLLLLVALEMLRGTDYLSEEEAPRTDPALVPLATPLVAGPGAIATVIVLARRYDEGSGRISVMLGIVAALAVVGLAMLGADKASKVIPDALITFLTRVFGLLLSAIAVQLVADGVQGMLEAS